MSMRLEPGGGPDADLAPMAHGESSTQGVPLARKASAAAVLFSASAAADAAPGLTHRHRRKLSGLESLNVSARGQLILEACEHKDAVEVLRAHLEAGADVHVTDVHGRTALFWCALLGNTEGARALLLAGADVNQSDENGWSPYDIARTLGHRDVADVIASCASELRALPKGSVFWAACTSHEDEGAEVLAAAHAVGASLDEVNASGRSAIHYAAMYGRSRATRLLLGFGAAVHQRDSSGRTPTAWAAVCGHMEVLRILLEAKGQAEGKAEDGESAMVLAAKNGNARAVRLLILGPAAVDPAPLFLSTRRAMVALIDALEPHELCRAVVLNARRLHPLITCLEGSYSLEKMHFQERGRDAASAAHMLAASEQLQKLACALTRTGASRSALLGTKLVPDGRTAVELAVDQQRKQFVALPVVQQYIDKIWYQGGIMFHATRRAGPVAYAAVSSLALLAAPLLLAASYVSSAFAVDVTIVFTALERFAAKEFCFFVYCIVLQFLRRVPESAQESLSVLESGSQTDYAYEGFLALWTFAIWVAELQHIAASRRAEKLRRSLVAEVWEVATSGWSGLDLVAMSYALVVACVRVAAHFDPHELAEVEVSMRTMGYLVLWLRLVHVLSVFSFTGPLIQMVVKMLVHDLLRWAFLQVLVLVSFASALAALFGGMDEHQAEANEHAMVAFHSIGAALKTLSEVAIGSDEPYPARTWELVAGSGLGWAILACYSVATDLLLLNLLIALLAHTVDSIRGRSQVEYLWGRAQTALAARTLPIIPPPFNLVHILCQAIGAMLSRPLRVCGLLPPALRAEEERAAARQAQIDAQHGSLLDHAAKTVIYTAGAVWGAVVGPPTAHSLGSGAREYWLRPDATELHHIWKEAWDDHKAEHPETVKHDANANHIPSR